MPHLTANVLERQLAGNEQALIDALTLAVVDVYGEWARELVSIRLIGTPSGRWATGGRVDDAAAPIVTFGIRASVLARPDAEEIVTRLCVGITDAVVSVLGEELRAGLMVELQPSPESLVSVGGVVGA